MNDLLIDVGSTNIKYSMDGKAVHSVPFPLPERDETPFYEVDAEKILAVIKGIIDSEPNSKNVWLSVQMQVLFLQADYG